MSISAAQATNGRLWISWESHTRSRVLATALNFELCEFTTLRRGAARYATLAFRTVRLLLKRRPGVLISQNPSLVLNALLATLRPFLRFVWIVDAHNEAVRPFVNRNRTVAAISRALLRIATLTIVSNDELAATVVRYGGRAYTLPDGLPLVPGVAPRNFGHGFHFLAIATFAPDEPIAAIFEAAKSLPDWITIHFTGDPKRSATPLPQPAANIRFLGYLPEPDYWAAILGCDAVIDISTMPDCLVCGAYEALSACKPMLLADNRASRSLFGSFSMFTSPTPADIKDALVAMACADRRSAPDLLAARSKYSLWWAERVTLLIHEINELSGSRASR